MKDPLLGPVAAIAGGILIARFVPFSAAELLAVIGAFLALGILSFVRRARFLAGTCCCLGLVFAGALTAVVHTPGPAPELDAEAREIVILGGCVVEPPAVSGERERFIPSPVDRFTDPFAWPRQAEPLYRWCDTKAPRRAKRKQGRRDQGC